MTTPIESLDDFRYSKIKDEHSSSGLEQVPHGALAGDLAAEGAQEFDRAADFLFLTFWIFWDFAFDG